MENTSHEATDEFYAKAVETIGTLQNDSVPDDVEFVLEQQITESDDLVGHFHVRIANGTVVVAPGAAPLADVVFRQDATTARSLQNGTTHAQGAFLTGRLSIDGDINKLLENGPLLAQLLSSATEQA